MPATLTLSRSSALAVCSTLAIVFVLVEGAKREDGADIQTWGRSGGANQSWLFRK